MTPPNGRRPASGSVRCAAYSIDLRTVATEFCSDGLYAISRNSPVREFFFPGTGNFFGTRENRVPLTSLRETHSRTCTCTHVDVSPVCVCRKCIRMTRSVSYLCYVWLTEVCVKMFMNINEPGIYYFVLMQCTMTMLVGLVGVLCQRRLSAYHQTASTGSAHSLSLLRPTVFRGIACRAAEFT